jgi:hypothetical protein
MVVSTTAEAKPPAGAPPRKTAKRPRAHSKPAGGALADALRRAGYNEASDSGTH